MSAAAYAGWAIVEVMGHRRHVGHVSEVTLAGVAMLRVEAVVGNDFDQRQIHLYPGSSLFSLKPISEEEARAEVAPPAWGVRPQLPAKDAEFVEADDEKTLFERLEETARILVERLTTGEHTAEYRLAGIRAELPALRDVLNDLDKVRGYSREPIPDDEEDDTPDSVDPSDLADVDEEAQG